MSPDQAQSDRGRAARHTDACEQTPRVPPTGIPGYEPRQFLGSGAYGEVWVASDRNTGRTVAIKFYKHRGGLDSSLLSREVEKLAFLSADRYVVQLLDVGWDSDPPYYVMEYVERGSLEEHVQRSGPMPVAAAVELFQDVAIGLVHAHGKGVLHCDLKPANILLDQDQKARLADFGQSRLSYEQKPALGTMFYMAPEQADLDAMPDARWDVYALGALLYWMLTGEPPRRNEKVVDKIDTSNDLIERLSRYREHIQSSPKPNAHRQVAGVDRALADMVDRCLAVDPETRFPNAQSVLSALQTRQKARARRPLMMLGFVGPAILLGVMAIFAWRGYDRSIGSSEQAVTRRAMESNRLTAQQVAKVVAGQLNECFTAVEEVARDRAFQELVVGVMRHNELSTLRRSLNNRSLDPPAEVDIRRRFRNHPDRRALHDYVYSQMKRPGLPASSWFVTDDHGTFIASTLDGESLQTPIDQTPLGKQRAFRTYFHGGPADLGRDQTPEKMIEKTHLSAVFQSVTTDVWKVAISTPIKIGGTTHGVLALTFELGKYLELPETDSRTLFAVLVDGREGPQKGVILEHPLFEQIINESHDRVPDRYSRYRVDFAQWSNGDVCIYKDPLGNDELGGHYRRDWIAAKAPVVLPRRDLSHRRVSVNGDGNDTGLLVLVQEDYSATTAPVHALGGRLVRDAMLALGLIIVVIVALWYFVLRLLEEPRRALSSFSDSAPLHSQETVAQSDT